MDHARELLRLLTSAMDEPLPVEVVRIAKAEAGGAVLLLLLAWWRRCRAVLVEEGLRLESSRYFMGHTSTWLARCWVNAGVRIRVKRA